MLSAFACDPTKGSEPGNGWNWAIGLANRGYEVHCLTRITGHAGIEQAEKPANLIFYHITLPFGLERLYSKSMAGMYGYYLLWQWAAFRRAKKLNRKIRFDIAHHVTWGSTQMGSFLYRLNIPFIFGPAGGGQTAPLSFKEYFGKHWHTEKKRERISQWLTSYNPSCRRMVRRAKAVLVSNPDTEDLVRSLGAKNVVTTLDAALPDRFFPAEETVKKPIPGLLKLLWVGRFMPRKGLLLVLEVMASLKDYPGITLTIVGDGELKEVVDETIMALGLSDTVTCEGKVPYEVVKNFYATHDVFFFTSLRDSCPAQLIEAMAYSMPVVTLDLHGQAVIVNEQVGIKCTCDNPESAKKALKGAILSFYNDQHQVIEKGHHAYRFANQQRWHTKIEQIVANYYPAS